MHIPISSMCTLLLAIWFTQGTLAQQPPASTQANSPDTPPTQLAAPKFQETQIKYAEAYLQLAEHELKMAEDINSALSPKTVEIRRKKVKVAEEQLRVAKLSAVETDTVPIHVRFAEESAKATQLEYSRVAAYTREVAQVYSESQVELFRLRAQVAQCRLEVLRDPSHLLSLLDHLHWQIDRLNEDIVSMQSRLELLER